MSDTRIPSREAPMSGTITAHVTDTHLGQRLVMDDGMSNDGMAGGKMRYVREPEQHEARFRLVLDSIVRKGVRDVVFGGDIGAPDSVAGFFAILAGYDITPTIVLGNHDDQRSVAPYCGAEAIEGKMCSARQDGPLKRIVLDTSDDSVGDAQRAWLARELDGARRVAIFVHHPILEIDTPVERSGAALADRREVEALLASVEGDVSVFCGHYHMLDEAREGNIRQFVTPAVSYQIVKQSDRLRVDTQTFGYRILEIDGAGIRSEVILLTQADGAMGRQRSERRISH